MLEPGQWTRGQEGCCGVGVQKRLMEIENHRWLSPLDAPLCFGPEATPQKSKLRSINIKDIEVSYPENLILL